MTNKTVEVLVAEGDSPVRTGEACRILGCSLPILSELLMNGSIKYVTYSQHGYRRIRPSDLAAFLEASKGPLL